MALNCILPERSNEFAKQVVDRLSENQRKRLGIKSNNDKEIATNAISSIARWYLDKLNQDKQDRALRDFNGFIKYLMDYVTVVKKSADVLDSAKERHNKLLETLKDSHLMPGISDGIIHHIEIPAGDTTTEEALDTILSSYDDIVDIWKDVDKTKRTTSVSFVVRIPEESGEQTAQERTLNQLERVKGSTRIAMMNRSTKAREIVDTKEDADVLRKQGYFQEGYILSNGALVKATSVSTDVHGITPHTFPVLAGPLGDVVDTTGRIFFDKKSQLWNDDGTLKDDAELEQIIDTDLKKALTLQGFHNLIDDFTALEEQINRLWGNGGKCVVYSGELRILGKKLWGDNKNTTLVGYPDLLVVDPKGKIHVLDMKSRIINPQTYDSPLTGENASTAKGYGEQISRYIGILKSLGLDVDPNPYVVLADTYYSTVHRQDSKDERDKFYVIEDDFLGIKGEKVGGEKGTVIPLREYITQKQSEGIDTNILGTMEQKEGNITLYYAEPRLHVKRNKEDKTQSPNALRGTEENPDIPVNSEVLFQRQYDALTDEEKKALSWEFGGSPVATTVTQGIIKLDGSRIDSDFKPNDMSNQEIQDVANMVMYKVSELLDQIQRGSNLDLQDVYYASKESNNSLPIVDADESDEWNPIYTLNQKYVGLSRAELIKKLGVKNLVLAAFTVVSNKYNKNFPTEEEYDNDDYDHESFLWESKEEFLRALSFNRKAEWLIDHKDQLFDWGTAKLRQLESCIVPAKNVKPENPEVENTEVGVDELDVEVDKGDNATIEDFQEAYIGGLTTVESWQMEAIHSSPKSTMSQDIKRLLEGLILRDANGNEIEDKHGWGFYQHVDSTKAIQTILDACTNCETMKQQEVALRALATGENSWILDLLNTLDRKENKSLKIKFFRTIRRDQNVYSYSYVTIKDGKRVVETRIANMKTANEAMRNALSYAFKSGNVGVYNINGKAESVITRGELKRIVIKGQRKDMSTTLLAKIGTDARNIAARISYIIDSAEKECKKRGIARLTYISDVLHNTLNDSDKNLTYNGMSLLEAMTNVLNGIGIVVPADVVERAIMLDPGRSANSGNAYSLMTFAVKAVSQIQNMVKNEGELPEGLAGNKANIGYFPIIDMLADSVQTYVESSTYQNGKTYYAFSNPSKFKQTVRNLKGLVGDNTDFLRYIHEEYGRYKGWFMTVDGESWLNDWVGQFEESHVAREALMHKSEISYLGKAYKELGELGFQLSILHNYFGSLDDRKKNPRYRWFPLPTMSNKTSNEFVRMIKYKDHDEIVDRVLMNTFKQEMNRMADVLHHFAYGKMATDIIDLTEKKLENAGWSKDEIEALKIRIKNQNVMPEDLARLSKLTSGAKFHFLWYLNSDISEDLKDNKRSPSGTEFKDTTFSEKITKKLNVLLTKDGKDKKRWNVDYDEDTVLKEVREHILSNMEEVVKSELEHMEEIGLFDVKKVGGKTVLKYQEEFGDLLGNTVDDNFAKSRENMVEALTDYIWQVTASNINIIQITGIDLAYFGSSKNYQKRIAQEHSPGIPLVNDPEFTDGYIRSIHISDLSVGNDIAPNIEAALMEYAEKSGLSGSAREDFEKMVSILVSKLGKTDATDGQSFNSITSVKKKLALQGLWGDKENDAYDKIKKGDFSIEHLGVLINPGKPFVAANVPRFSGSTTMTLRKTPIQDKNSEYLLLLAEAILTGAGKRSRLAVIHDFMEATAQMHPKQGIDTVHFESVNKEGKHGIIDLNYFDEHYDEIYDEALANGWIQGADKSREGAYKELGVKYMLNHVARPKKETGGENLTEDDLSEEDLPSAYRRYNNDYVDTIPVDRYVIQQEVPAHLADKSGALYGSQIRILGISDISSDAEFDIDGGMKADALVKEYKQLHADNIEDSYNELMEDYGLIKAVNKDGSIDILRLNDMTTEQRNRFYRNLELMLKVELSKDGKYTNDVRNSCTLIEDEYRNVVDFAVPLMDPCQSRRVQELINSIIKKRISRQRIKGGATVQVTAYDNNLSIRFKGKDGKPIPTFKEYGRSKGEYIAMLKARQASIDYFECYVPIPDDIIRRFLTKPNGTIMSFDEAKKALPEDVFKSLTQIIGYRIPTEDKYSMIPMRAVGFVPRAAGEVVILPKEITFLTGSDFDIDKMYLMLKSFHAEEEKESNAASIIGEYITETGVNLYFLNRPKIDGSDKHYKKVSDEHNAAVVEAIKEVIKLSNSILSGSGDVWSAKSLAIKNNSLGNVKNIENFMEWYQRRVLKTAFSEYTNTRTESRRKNREARNNRILDLQWAVLTNEDTLPKILNPGNFNVQKAVAKRIALAKAGHKWSDLKKMTVDELENLMEQEDKHNITLPSSQLYYQHQNMQGTQMVGIFANSNVSHAFLTFQQVGIALNKNDLGDRDSTFRFCGIRIGDKANPTILDPQYGNDGTLISKVLASFLAASVDTAKDPVLADMNVNTFTGDVATTLIRMGFDTETVGLFLSQPAIMKLTELYAKESTDSFYSTETAMKTMAANYFGMTRKDLIDTTGIKQNEMSIENFVAHLNDDLDSKEGKEFQKRVLRAFYQLYKIASDVKELTFCTKFNSVSNAVGPTIADTMEDAERVRLFKEKNNSGNSVFYMAKPSEDSLDGRDDRGFTSPNDVIKNDPILNAFYRYTMGEEGASQVIFEKFFPHYYPGFGKIKDTFQEEYYGGKKIPAKLLNHLVNSYMYYLLTYDFDIVDGESVEHVKPVMPVNMSIEEVVSAFEDVLKIKNNHPDMQPNNLLDQALGNNCITIRKADERLAIDTLIFNMSKLGTEGQQAAMTAWGDLITMNDPVLSKEENEIMRAFGRNLFFYTLMRNGFTYSPYTMMPVASMIVKYNAIYDNGYQNYVEGLREMKKRDKSLLEDEVIADRFLNQFMRNNYGNNQLAPTINILEDRYNADFGYNEGRLTGYVNFPYNKDSSENLYRIMLSNNKPRQFITVLYKNPLTREIIKELYELSSSETVNSNTVLRYVKVNRLGMKNNFIEYNANEDIDKSRFEEARKHSSSEDEEDDVSPSRTSKEEQGYDDESYDAWSETITPALMNLGYSKERIKKFKDAHVKATDDSPFAIAVQNLFDAIQEGSDDETLRKLSKDMEDTMEKNDMCKSKS